MEANEQKQLNEALKQANVGLMGLANTLSILQTGLKKNIDPKDHVKLKQIESLGLSGHLETLSKELNDYTNMCKNLKL